MRHLAGRSFVSEAAVLQGYRKIVGETPYPFIIPDTDSHVSGTLLRQVDSEALARFDRYEDEGRLYQRIPVLVEIGGVAQPCHTYVGAAIAVAVDTAE